jgi:hypothetical protein
VLQLQKLLLVSSRFRAGRSKFDSLRVCPGRAASQMVTVICIFYRIHFMVHFQLKIYRISGSHIGAYEEFCHLGYIAV